MLNLTAQKRLPVARHTGRH